MQDSIHYFTADALFEVCEILVKLCYLPEHSGVIHFYEICHYSPQGIKNTALHSHAKRYLCYSVVRSGGLFYIIYYFDSGL